MTDQPGVSEALKDLSPVKSALETPPLSVTPHTESFLFMQNLLSLGSERRSFEQDKTIMKGITSYIYSLGDRYRKDIVLASRNENSINDFNKNFSEAFNEWYSTSERSFKSLPAVIDRFKDALTPAEFLRLNNYISNLRHDSLLTLNGIDHDIKSNEKTFLNNYAIEWPSHVITRIVRQIQNKPEIESFDPSEVGAYLSGLFEVLSHDTPNFHLDFNIDPNIHSVTSDKLYFEGAIFNLIRNAQVIMQQRLNPSAEMKIHVNMELVNGQVVLTVQDNGGGFKTADPERNMLNKTERKDQNGNVIKDANGNPIMIQKAFIRGETNGTGGTGFGLDIVRQITEDHLNGTVSAENAPFPDSETIGAKVIMKFPYS